MIMEGADKTAGSFFRHWKAIFILVLLIGSVLAWKRWSAAMISTVDIWSIEQQKKADMLAKAAESARAEDARKTAAAKAEADKLEEKQKQEREAKKPKAFYISERYWVCLHKVVSCEVDPKGNRNDPSKALKCDAVYSVAGSGFGKPQCSEGDFMQATFALKTKNGTEKLDVPMEAYSKHEAGSWIFLMCNETGCDSKIIDPPPPEPSTSAVPAVSSPPVPQPSAVTAPTLDPRGVNRFSLLPTKH